MSEDVITTKKYKIITFFTGIITILPFYILILNMVNITKNEEAVELAAIYIPLLIGNILYVAYVKRFNKLRLTFLVIGIVTMVISFLGMYDLLTMEHTGIDYIGEALVYGITFRIGLTISRISAIVLFILYNKQFLFKKTTIISIISIIVIITVGILIYENSKTEKTYYNQNELKSVSDFEHELKKRGLIAQNTTQKIYGVKKGLKKAISLDFNKDVNQKYPLYVYAGYENWLIYYINGQIYAVNGVYYHSNKSENFKEEEKIIWKYPYKIISESEKVYVYDMKKDCYETGSYYYYDDNHILL